LRIATFLDEYCDGDSAPFGHYIERETGIEALSHSGFGSYVVWKTVACDLPIAELLDVITAIARFAPTRSIRNDRMTVTYDFLNLVSQAFSEERFAYRLDERGGVHPYVDQLFTPEMGNLIEALISPSFSLLGSISSPQSWHF
jgi:hypothetical protein